MWVHWVSDGACFRFVSLKNGVILVITLVIKHVVTHSNGPLVVHWRISSSRYKVIDVIGVSLKPQRISYLRDGHVADGPTRVSSLEL